MKSYQEMAAERGSQQAYPHVCRIMQVHEDGTMTTRPLTQGGMTKRELFAAMAMQGYISAAVGSNPDERAKRAVEQADALLRKLEEAK